MRSRHLPNLLLAIAALLAVAIMAEIALRVLAPVANPYEEIEKLKPSVNQYIRFEYPRHFAAVTEAEPGLPGLSGVNRFTTNNMGFRGDSLAVPKPAGEFRIFLLGGSTTECFYLDDNDDLARVVQRELTSHARPGAVIKVYGAGYSGAASDDHVAMLSQRIVHLEPDLVVVFAGINDLTRSIYGHDYLHFIEYRPAYRKPWFKRLPMRLQIVQRLFYLRLRVVPDPEQMQEQRSLVTNYAGLVGLQRTVAPSDTPPRTDVGGYQHNLSSLIGIARANGFEVAFMTQQTTWNSSVDPRARRWHWMRLRGGITYREDLMDAALETLNDVVRSLGEHENVPVYDLARVLPKSLEYFYDDCHFNTAGATAAGRGLATFLAREHVVPATTDSSATDARHSSN